MEEAALLERTAALAQRFQPFELELEVAWLADFLALRPAEPPPELAELAAACVIELDALTDRERPLKARAGLHPRQERLNLRWGYPYVFEQYRFHLTLSGRLAPDSAAGARWSRLHGGSSPLFPRAGGRRGAVHGAGGGPGLPLSGALRFRRAGGAL